MVVAYVLITANTGDADRLKRDVAAVDGVTDVHIVAGDVDLIARVEVEDTPAVKDVVVTAVQSIDGVAETRTYLTMD
ncbi:MAG: Lrp/AsnC family transcriptional regulator [Haloplanus sp.]